MNVALFSLACRNVPTETLGRFGIGGNGHAQQVQHAFPNARLIFQIGDNASFGRPSVGNQIVGILDVGQFVSYQRGELMDQPGR
jgi:hypothetical protein